MRNMSKKQTSKMKLTKDFYTLNAVEMAPQLLGKLLCRNIDGNIVKCMITETEAYFGSDDTACHAHKGKTKRTEIMYNQGGYAYIYLCYGIHSLLNIVSGEKEHPEAVLIRGVKGYNGPGKLTKALNIDRSLNNENLVNSSALWIEDNNIEPNFTTHKRIGIDYATSEYKDVLWRFVIED